MQIRVRISLVAMCLLAAGRAVAAAAPAETPVGSPSLPAVELRSLHYGDVLFHFFQDDYFNGIVRATAFREQGFLKAHREDSELVLGGMYLAFGQYRQAVETLDRLLDAPATPPPVRDRALFFLGKALYEHGRWEESERLLRRIAGPLPADVEAERRLLLAQDLMRLDRFDRAAEELAGWNGAPDWTAYARFNLGVALVRSGRDTEGLALLEQVGTIPGDTEELRSLRDKANVAAGFALLRAERPVDASRVLQRVRLNGPQSSRALLAAGWAAAAQGRYEQALGPWMELQGRDVLDAAVQEAQLAVPYALARLGAAKQAADHYEAAIGLFDAESLRLDESIQSIRSGRMVEVLSANDEATLPAWYSHLTRLPDTPEARYLYLLMAGNEFQEGLRSYRTLGFLQRNLRGWQDSIAAFRDMVDTRRVAFDERLPAALQALERLDVASIERHRDTLQSRLESADRDHDAVALADTKEIEAWSRVQTVQAELDSRPEDPDLDEARDKLRLARGVLLWDMEREYKLRRFTARRSLKALSTAVAELRTRATSVKAASRASPDRNRELLARIAAIEPRLSTMITAVVAAQERQGRYLAGLAASELEAQKLRLAEYRTQARYALATTYDRASQTTRAEPPAR